MTDQMTGHENARHEIAGMKMTDAKLQSTLRFQICGAAAVVFYRGIPVCSVLKMVTTALAALPFGDH